VRCVVQQGYGLCASVFQEHVVRCVVQQGYGLCASVFQEPTV